MKHLQNLESLALSRIKCLRDQLTKRTFKRCKER